MNGEGTPLDGTWLREVRERLGLTQGDFGSKIGLSTRGVQDIEGQSARLRYNHVIAARMVSLEIAVSRGEPMLALPPVRKLALDLARMITEG